MLQSIGSRIPSPISAAVRYHEMACTCNGVFCFFLFFSVYKQLELFQKNLLNKIICQKKYFRHYLLNFKITTAG